MTQFWRESLLLSLLALLLGIVLAELLLPTFSSLSGKELALMSQNYLTTILAFVALTFWLPEVIRHWRSQDSVLWRRSKGL